MKQITYKYNIPLNDIATKLCTMRKKLNIVEDLGNGLDKNLIENIKLVENLAYMLYTGEAEIYINK